MTDTTFSQQKVPLGIGTILGDTFLILLKRIVPLFIIGLIPSVIIFAMFTGTLGMRGLLGLDQVQPSVLMGAAYWITVIANYVVYFATAAFLVQLIYDAKLNRPARLASYVASTVSSIIPVALLGIVVTLLFFVGAMFLVLPGFWIYAVFSVTVPAIVIERAGFGGMKRSAQLTKGYRWPIVVVIFIVTVCSIIFSMGAQFFGQACRYKYWPHTGNRALSRWQLIRSDRRNIVLRTHLCPPSRNQGRCQRQPDRGSFRLTVLFHVTCSRQYCR